MHRLTPIPVSGLFHTIAVVLLLAAGPASATADGPDFFRVMGVAANDVLNIRAEPDPHAKKIGEIPPDGICVRNLGCQGGLTYREFTSLTEAQKAARLKASPRWCQVEYRGAPAGSRDTTWERASAASRPMGIEDAVACESLPTAVLQASAVTPASSAAFCRRVC